MLPALLLPLIAQVSAETALDPLLDFSKRPEGATQLVGEAGHVMVPEGEGPGLWTFDGGVLTASPEWDSVLTPAAYGDLRMHVEFRVNLATSENRETNGNSGVYVQQRYEIQILDSHGISPEDYQLWDCGSLYRLKRPDVPACRPAEEWQSYDILFRAARFEGEEKVEDARITVFQNGVLIHDDVQVPRKTGAGQPEGPEPRQVKLQGHHNQVAFRNVWIQGLELERMPAVPRDDPRRVSKALPRPGMVFPVAGRVAFVIEPEIRPTGPMPWVWYAPTLRGLPGPEEGWLIDLLVGAGVAVAGIDVGESFGSPAGRRGYEALHAHLTSERGYSQRPALLARSRGGLMLYSWAVEHPRSVAGIAGIYPVCNLTSYPGLERAAPAYGLDAAGLEAELSRHNPIDRLAPLAAEGVPLLHIHGDRDGTVPLEENSALLAERYMALDGPVEVLVQEGRGHDMWEGWFRSRAIAEFLVHCARRGATEVPEESQRQR